MDNKCNGWTNRETWLVSLWFGDTFTYMAENGHKTSADHLREEVELYLEEKGATSGFIADMMDMRAINWQELAERFSEND